MYSEGQLARQIYLDGRTHPSDPNPTWRGHTIGHWEGDTLAADTIGFNDKAWLDWSGHSQTEVLHVVERYRRPDLGHLELEMTVEDRSALKTPWLIKRTYILDPKVDILENVCAENEKDWSHLVKNKPRDLLSVPGRERRAYTSHPRLLPWAQEFRTCRGFRRERSASE
jgi:hypothetical protein